MATTTNNKERIGDYVTIAEQLGGNKFLAMTGSKFLYHGRDDNGYVNLMVKLARNQSKAQYLKIQYNSMDLYDLEFSRIKRTQNPEYKDIGLKIYDEEYITLKTFENVYGDQLEEIFEDVTGLYTRL